MPKILVPTTSLSTQSTAFIVAKNVLNDPGRKCQFKRPCLRWSGPSSYVRKNTQTTLPTLTCREPTTTRSFNPASKSLERSCRSLAVLWKMASRRTSSQGNAGQNGEWYIGRPTDPPINPRNVVRRPAGYVAWQSVDEPSAINTQGSGLSILDVGDTVYRAAVAT